MPYYAESLLPGLHTSTCTHVPNVPEARCRCQMRICIVEYEVWVCTLSTGNDSSHARTRGFSLYLQSYTVRTNAGMIHATNLCTDGKRHHLCNSGKCIFFNYRCRCSPGQNYFQITDTDFCPGRIIFHYSYRFGARKN